MMRMVVEIDFREKCSTVEDVLEVNVFFWEWQVYPGFFIEWPCADRVPGKSFVRHRAQYYRNNSSEGLKIT